jgi:hypothetical protein
MEDGNMAPYIQEERRGKYAQPVSSIVSNLMEDGFPVGDITYVIYRIVLAWWMALPSYQTICEIRGVLIGTMAEFDRRESAMYEDEKLEENGDV